MMTPKARREAQLELKDWAQELEYPPPTAYGETAQQWGQRRDRRALLRAIAAELERVPEEP